MSGVFKQGTLSGKARRDSADSPITGDLCGVPSPAPIESKQLGSGSSTPNMCGVEISGTSFGVVMIVSSEVYSSVSTRISHSQDGGHVASTTTSSNSLLKEKSSQKLSCQKFRGFRDPDCENMVGPWVAVSSYSTPDMLGV